MYMTTEDFFESVKEERVVIQKDILQNAIQNAIKLLFGKSVSPDAVILISKFIQKEFNKQNCCVLYKFSGDFLSLCKSLHLEKKLGNQEVIIMENQSILYTPNYAVAPRPYTF